VCLCVEHFLSWNVPGGPFFFGRSFSARVPLSACTCVEVCVCVCVCGSMMPLRCVYAKYMTFLVSAWTVMARAMAPGVRSSLPPLWCEPSPLWWQKIKKHLSFSVSFQHLAQQHLVRASFTRRETEFELEIVPKLN